MGKFEDLGEKRRKRYIQYIGMDGQRRSAEAAGGGIVRLDFFLTSSN